MASLLESNSLTPLPNNKVVGRFRNLLDAALSSSWMSGFVSLCGALLYLYQLIRYSRLLPSNLDEGVYLYKGLLYISGKYSIYQFYGPWNNKMPLAFLVPGFFQNFLKPGLETGRGMAVVLALLILIGLWILVQRLGNHWWAAGLVWVIAINSALIKMYSLAVSQVLIASMLVWALVFILGKDRKTWNIFVGSFLIGLIAMTRENMILIIPLFILYIYFQHGLKPSLLAVVVSVITMGSIYALFWPGILQVWAFKLPRWLTPFLDNWRNQPQLRNAWSPTITRENQLLSITQAVRIHFTALISVLCTILLWPASKKWQNRSNLITATFIAAFIIILSTIHAIFSLGDNYCVYCLQGYLAFFSFVGLLIIPLSINIWKFQIPLWLQIFIVVLILTVTIGIGFGAYEQIGNQLIEVQIPRSILEFPDKQSGTIPLENYLRQNYGYDFKTSRRLVSIGFGFTVALLTLGIALFCKICQLKPLGQKQPEIMSNSPSYGYWAIISFLLVGTLMSPVIELVGENNEFYCNRNVITSYREAGEHLAKKIPAGSKVYWKGGNSVVPLLYLKDINIYPAQLNGDYSFKVEGEIETLLKFGLWSEELAEIWIKDADYVLVQQRFYDEWYRDRLKSGDFEELESTLPTTYCIENSNIRVFKRIK